MSTAQSTTNHEKIKIWITERGGKPAIVKGTETTGDSAGLLRVKFTDDEDLQEIDWQEFFSTFDDNDLRFLYEPESSSRFFKFIYN